MQLNITNFLDGYYYHTSVHQQRFKYIDPPKDSKS